MKRSLRQKLNSFDQCNYELYRTRKITKRTNFFIRKNDKNYFQSQIMRQWICYKFCDEKLDPQCNFETKGTYLNFENSPNSQSKLRTQLIPEIIILLFNLSNRSIFNSVEKKLIRDDKKCTSHVFLILAVSKSTEQKSEIGYDGFHAE